MRHVIVSFCIFAAACAGESRTAPEIHKITSGTGRFANASGTFTVVQTRGLSMPYFNSATIDGTIDLGH